MKNVSKVFHTSGVIGDVSGAYTISNDSLNLLVNFNNSVFKRKNLKFKNLKI